MTALTKPLKYNVMKTNAPHSRLRPHKRAPAEQTMLRRMATTAATSNDRGPTKNPIADIAIVDWHRPSSASSLSLRGCGCVVWGGGVGMGGQSGVGVGCRAVGEAGSVASVVVGVRGGGAFASASHQRSVP